LIDVNLIALALNPLRPITLRLITLRLITLGLIALGLIGLGLIGLGLIALGASYLTAADRTPPSAAGPVSTVGVSVRLVAVLLIAVLRTRTLLRPALLIRGNQLNGSQRLHPTRLRPTRHDGARRDGRSDVLLGCRGISLIDRGGARLGNCPRLGRRARLGGILSHRAVERELLSGRPPLPGDGTLALFDRGDQVILTHTGDVGDAHLASHLAQLRHHHSRQPGTATRRRPVARRRHSAASLVGWALVRRFRSNNVAAQQVDIAHAGPS
jgi:hypothetical protein